MAKLISEMESTYKVGLGNRRIYFCDAMNVHTSGSHCIFEPNRKNRLAWFPVRFVFNTYIGASEAAMASVFTLQHQVRPLAAVRTNLKPLHCDIAAKKRIFSSGGTYVRKRKTPFQLCTRAFSACSELSSHDVCSILLNALQFYVWGERVTSQTYMYSTVLYDEHGKHTHSDLRFTGEITQRSPKRSYSSRLRVGHQHVGLS